jgi:hypothetical protein
MSSLTEEMTKESIERNPDILSECHGEQFRGASDVTTGKHESELCIPPAKFEAAYLDRMMDAVFNYNAGPHKPPGPVTQLETNEFHRTGDFRERGNQYGPLNTGMGTTYENPILEDREAMYGKPEINLGCQAQLVDPYVRFVQQRSILRGEDFHSLSSADIAIIMCLVKIGRIATGEYHEDNFTDLKGYAELAGQLARPQGDTGE